MKKIDSALIALFACLFFFAACTKNDPQQIQDDGPQLAAFSVEFIDTFRHTTEVDTFTLNYDAMRRISSTAIQLGTQAKQPEYDLHNSGSTILMTEPPKSGYFSGTDTIWHFLDGDGRLVKKIQHLWWRLDDPGFKPHSFQRDTIFYQYNAAGLVTKTIRSFQDSTWSANNGQPKLLDQHLSEVTIHSISNNNLSSMVSSGNWTHRNYVPSISSDVTTKSSQEVTKTFEYTKGYLNKFDYSNIAVLNNFSWLTYFPMDKGYTNLPDKMTITDIRKDENGTVTFSTNTVLGFTFSYNAEGFISSRVDNGGQIAKVTYHYSK